MSDVDPGAVDGGVEVAPEPPAPPIETTAVLENPDPPPIGAPHEDLPPAPAPPTPTESTPMHAPPEPPGPPQGEPGSVVPPEQPGGPPVAPVIELEDPGLPQIGTPGETAGEAPPPPTSSTPMDAPPTPPDVPDDSMPGNPAGYPIDLVGEPETQVGDVFGDGDLDAAAAGRAEVGVVPPGQPAGGSMVPPGQPGGGPGAGDGGQTPIAPGQPGPGGQEQPPVPPGAGDGGQSPFAPGQPGLAGGQEQPPVPPGAGDGGQSPFAPGQPGLGGAQEQSVIPTGQPDGPEDVTAPLTLPVDAEPQLGEPTGDPGRDEAPAGGNSDVPAGPIVIEGEGDDGLLPDHVLVHRDHIDQLELDAARGRRAQLEALIRSRAEAGQPELRPTPTATVIRTVVAQPTSAGDVVAAAANAGVAPDPDPMDLGDAKRLFEELGVETELRTDASLLDLTAALEDGRGVVIGIRDEDGTTRAVIITGIDAARGIVYAFEPPDGELVELRLDDLLEEWERGGNRMLLVGETDEAADEEGGRRFQLPSGATMAILPITLGAGAVAAGATHVLRKRQDGS